MRPIHMKFSFSSQDKGLYYSKAPPCAKEPGVQEMCSRENARQISLPHVKHCSVRATKEIHEMQQMSNPKLVVLRNTPRVTLYLTSFSRAHLTRRFFLFFSSLDSASFSTFTFTSFGFFMTLNQSSVKGQCAKTSNPLTVSLFIKLFSNLRKFCRMKQQCCRQAKICGAWSSHTSSWLLRLVSHAATVS